MNRDFVPADRQTLYMFFGFGSAGAVLLGILIGVISGRFGLSVGDAVLVGFCVALALSAIPPIAITFYSFQAAKSIIVGRLEVATGRNLDNDPRIGNADKADIDPRGEFRPGNGMPPVRLPLSQGRIDVMVYDVIQSKGYFTEGVLVDDGNKKTKRAFTSNGRPFLQTKDILEGMGFIAKVSSAANAPYRLTSRGEDAFYHHNNTMPGANPSPTDTTPLGYQKIGA